MRMLVTGGCGFIGSHTSRHFLREGWQVHVMDDASRAGTSQNLQWIRQAGPVIFHRTDIREAVSVRRVFLEHGPFDAVVHLAGQVAVTKSVEDPMGDFTANALGTLHLLEATRAHAPEAAFVYASTNKVYGGMNDVPIAERRLRCEYAELPFGVDETRPLDFHSPYGCSKGAADQYVRDYARIYGLKTVVFRQSCIYGTHQYGIEDQGWVAWFCIAATLGKPITIYGNGKQMRDVLYVEDLVHAYARAIDCIENVAGEVFNIGGGSGRTLSILELLGLLENRLGRAVPVSYAPCRPGDQRVCVMDVRKAEQRLDWSPEVEAPEGIDRLLAWIGREFGSHAAAPAITTTNQDTKCPNVTTATSAS